MTPGVTVQNQPIENVDGFVDATRDEVTEQRDVHVGHVIVPSAPAVAGRAAVKSRAFD